MGDGLAQDEALLLVAHGSERYADAGRWVRSHAAALAAGGAFAQVGVGLLNGAPSSADALAELSAPVVRIVPFFMEAGWFTRSAVPRALGLQGDVTQRDGQTLRYASPVGTHPAMASLIEQRVRRFGGGVPALVVVGHGSARSPGRVTALHDHVATLNASRAFEVATAAFLEEPPFAADAMAGLRDRPLAVLGFFAGEGGHVREDLPNLIAAEQARRDCPLIDCGIIAEEPELRRIILDLATGTA